MRLRGGTSFLEPPPPLLQLPDPLLQAVLQQLSTRDVLRAARSCAQLRAAAAAALDSIKASVAGMRFADSTCLDSLLLYLEHHGQHVSSLDMDVLNIFAGTPLARLPASCSRLQALGLGAGLVQLGASDSQPGVLQAASALASLCINGTTLRDSVKRTAAVVARLTQLQRLELNCARFPCSGPDDFFSETCSATLPGRMLAPLTALTALHLSTYETWVQAATLVHLSSLRGLRELQLTGSTLGPALTALQHLQQLTALALTDVDAPCLSGMSSSLQRLELQVHVHECVIQPQELTAYTQLRHLHLYECELAAGPEAGTAALLVHLQRCTQLTCLDLYHSFARTLPAEVYAALTASSSLEVLQLEGSDLPLAAWQPMFGGSKCLPRLRKLVISFQTGAAAGVPPADLAALARCCPALQHLQLDGLQGTTAANLLPLTVLTALTALYAGARPSPVLADFLTPPGQPSDVVSRLHELLRQQHAAQDQEEEEGAMSRQERSSSSSRERRRWWWLWQRVAGCGLCWRCCVPCMPRGQPLVQQE